MLTMKGCFLVFILVIGVFLIHGIESNDHHIVKRGSVQDYVDTHLARSGTTATAFINNHTLINDTFTLFKKIHGRKYQNASEEQKRLGIFKQRLLNIVTINLDTTSTFDTEVNTYSDWTDEEFNSRKKGFDTSAANQKKKRKRRGVISNVINSVSASTTSSLDWVSKGYVTPVRDQETCSDCYAFATMAVLEGAWVRKTGQLVEFSPQEITDCSSAQGNLGCNGGNFVLSIRYLNTIGGRISKWADYIYTNGVRSCRISANTVSTPYKFGTIQYSQIPESDENSLMEALKQGPVFVGINADTPTFMSYKSGVINLNSLSCPPSGIDHAVTLVGYGHDSRTGLDYWKIKNSWSTSWGEAGYVRMARGKNICGIANTAYKVILT